MKSDKKKVGFVEDARILWERKNLFIWFSAVWHTGSGWKLPVWSEQCAGIMCGVLVWDNSSVRAASQLILDTRGDISYRCRTWWVRGMLDQSPCLGLDLFCLSPDYVFYHSPLFNMVYVTLRLLCYLTKVFEKPAVCWAWEHCLVVLFCSWCKILADLDCTFFPVLKHRSLGLWMPFYSWTYA